MDAFTEFVFRDFLAERFDSARNDRVRYLFFEREQNVGALYGLNSEMMFGRVVYKKGDEIFRTDSLAVKRPKNNLGAEFAAMQLVNEIHFFTRVVPLLGTSVTRHADIESFFPKFYHSCIKEAPGCSEAVLIYENLRDLGYLPPSPKISPSSKEIYSNVFLDYLHLSLMMRKLGQFHGHSFVAMKKNRAQFQLVTNFVPGIHERFMSQLFVVHLSLIHFLRLILADPHYSTKVTASFAEKVHNLEKFLPYANESKSMAVVCHGDFTTTNVLFKYDKNGVPVDMKMLDLGMWQLATPALDLAHVLYINADQQTRNLYWNDLMDDYFGGLADILPVQEIPSRQNFLEGFKKSSLHILTIASFFIPDLFAHAKKELTTAELFAKFFPNTELGRIGDDDNVKKVFQENEVGGKEGTEAVLNLIKDMIDRSFI